MKKEKEEMKKICRQVLDFAQVFTSNGDVRICSWYKEAVIGNLVESTFPSIMNSENAKRIREEISSGCFSGCHYSCPYVIA